MYREISSVHFVILPYHLMVCRVPSLFVIGSWTWNVINYLNYLVSVTSILRNLGSKSGESILV